MTICVYIRNKQVQCDCHAFIYFSFFILLISELLEFDFNFPIFAAKNKGMKTEIVQTFLSNNRFDFSAPGITMHKCYIGAMQMHFIDMLDFL